MAEESPQQKTTKMAKSGSASTEAQSQATSVKSEETKKDEISNMALYSIMCLMLLFGTLNTVVMKLQDQVVVGTDKDGKPKTFTHPYFQCAVMFAGELFCMVLFGFKKAFGPSDQALNNINPLLVSIPAMFDICGSTLMFIALTMCAASVYQMMRGVIVVITAVMAIFFLGRKQFFHHWASLFTIVLGVFIVGFVSIMASHKEADLSVAGQTSVLGILLLLGAQCFTGGQFVTEEKLFDGRSLDPLYVVGLEGFWGCLIFAILLPIFQTIECDGPLCHNGKLEDTSAAIQEYQAHPILLAQSICNILSIAGFNVTGVMITKYASAAQRSTVDTCRTLVIWCVFLAMGSEKFLIGELFGFFLLVLGTLVYNEIIEIPIPAFSKNTKRNRDLREQEAQKKEAAPRGNSSLGTGSSSGMEQDDEEVETLLKQD